MSRIPVFIERSARKGWNNTVEPCIFIACDSVETSSEIGDVQELVHSSANDSDIVLHGFNAVNNVSDILEYSEDRLIDKVQLNDTEESKLDEESQNFGTSPLHECNKNKENTSVTLTVVSCSKGVINSTCSCHNCCEGVSLNEFVTGNGFQEDAMKTVEGEWYSKGVKCMIPRPTRLTSGKIALTPAPLKKSKSKAEKKGKQELREKNETTKTEFTDADGKKFVGNGRFGKRIVGRNESCSKQAYAGCLKRVYADHENEKLDTSKEKRQIYTDRGNRHKSNDMADSTCTESGLYRSQHDLEDSEPEYAQHEMQKGENGSSVYNESFRTKVNGTAENKTRLLGNQTVTEVVHNDFSDDLLKDERGEKGTIKLVKAVTPRGSGIPKFQHHKYVEGCCEKLKSNNWHSPRSRCVSVSSNIGVTSRTFSRSGSRGSVSSRNSSVSPNRNSVASVHNAITPSPRPRQSLKMSKSGLEVERNNCSNDDNLNRNNKKTTVILNSPKVYETKASKLRRQIFSSVADNCRNNQERKISNSGRVHESAAVPTLKNDTKENSFQSRRNLPQAPSEVRKVRYGQRCVVDDDEAHEDIVTVSQSRPVAVPTRSSNGRPPSGQTAGPSTGGGGGKAKRPAWDLKGRLQDMEEQWKKQSQEKNEFLSQMQKCTERIALLENHNDQLSGTVAQKEENYTHASREIEQLQKKLRGTEDELYDVKRQFERDTENFEFTKASLRRQKEALEGEITGLQQEVAGLKTSVAQLTSSQAGLKSELDATKLALDQANSTIVQRDSSIHDLQQKLAEQIAVNDDLNSKCREHETVRRKLHNTIQELKGNIRVFCRVRPLIGEELLGNDGEIQHMNFPEEQKTLELERLADVSLSESTIGGNRKGNGRYEFNFDRVFAPASKQSEVFEEISQLVQSALDGYNVCIFAYGQTGSGKTYTMEGPSVEDEENRGMISRAVLQIFSSTRELEDKGWQYEFEGSFLEIYNETIRDLLGNHAADVKHEIKMTGTGGNDVMVTNLTTVPITCENQITDLLKMASKNRAVGETNCNERSSRSHSVFRLKITGCNDITQEQCKGTLNLVDLAGSERLKESGATGQRLKETQNINKSLSNLGNVIMALGNKENHVPYRNSKLTYLLQNSLGGNSKTLMFVNVSPREENFSETLNSLRFATKVNQCNIGTATKKSK